MCLFPKIIKNRKYISNKKNGGVIPAICDNRTLYVPIGCGKCMECVRKKSREWQVRLAEEIKENTNGKFVTLTFSEESLIKLGKEVNEKKNKKLYGYELDNEIATRAVRLFLERWRKKYKKSVRHWLTTELGTTKTERIHLHGLIFTDIKKEEIASIWGYGYADARDKSNGGEVSEKTINYIIKYVSKKDEKHKEYKAVILCSKGIGKGYTKSYNAQKNRYNRETNETYKNKQGYKIALPIYYRNKIYTEQEREKLWIEKLDKNIRYVDGTKIDITNGEEEYYKALESARQKNKALGYGDDSINWERKKYEQERRNLIKFKKITKQEEKRKKRDITPDERNINYNIPLGNIKDAW